MGFSLTNDELREREIYISDLEAAGEKLSAAVAVFNAAMRNAFVEFEREQEEFNKSVRVAQLFVESIHTKYNAKFEAKTEEWRDGDRGEQVNEWLSEWTVILEESDIEIPEPMEIVGSVSEDLEALPIKATEV